MVTWDPASSLKDEILFGCVCDVLAIGHYDFCNFKNLKCHDFSFLFGL